MTEAPDNAMDWTPVDALQSAIRHAQDVDPDAAVALLLTTRDGKYDVNYSISGIPISGAIALLEVAKMRLLQQMNEPEEI